MEIVEIEIGRQQYKLTCDEAEKEKIIKLSKILDAKIKQLSTTLPAQNINHQLMLVIIALSLQDDLLSFKEKVSGLEEGGIIVNDKREQRDNNLLKDFADSLDKIMEKISIIDKDIVD